MQPQKNMKLWAKIITTTAILTTTQWASAETIRVAVASNFSATLQALAKQFEKESGHTVKISSASTGKLYAQIIHGAPFDIFFSADAYRPELLAQQFAKTMTEGTEGANDTPEQQAKSYAKNHAKGSNKTNAKTYAYGRLVFLAYVEDKATHKNNQTCIQQLSASSIKRVAIANPVTAPYGLAAKQTLESMGLWAKVESKIVMGENIAQTLHFVDSQNAQAGFVAKAQLFKHKINNTCQWDILENHHDRIEQKMIKLQPQKLSAATHDFWDFISSRQARTLIQTHGYHVPDSISDSMPDKDNK